MTLYPHPLNRIAIAASTLFLGCLVWMLAEPIWLLAPILIAGVILSVRCYRMSVTCTPSALVVRGMLVTRTISRSAITSIHEDARTVPRGTGGTKAERADGAPCGYSPYVRVNCLSRVGPRSRNSRKSKRGIALNLRQHRQARTADSPARHLARWSAEEIRAVAHALDSRRGLTGRFPCRDYSAPQHTGGSFDPRGGGLAHPSWKFGLPHTSVASRGPFHARSCRGVCRAISVEGWIVSTARIASPGIDSQWRPVFRLAAVSAVLVTVFIPVQALVFILFPPPRTVPEYFVLFEHNPLLGLLDLDLLLTIDYLAMIPFYLALFASIERVARAWAALALIVGLFSLALYLISREATFSMWLLSSQHASAHTTAEETALVGAGQTLLTLYNGSSFGISYVLGAISTLTFSAVMLRRHVFGRLPGIVGIITGITMLVPPNIGKVGVVIAMLSLIPTVVWLILLSRAFFKLARDSGGNTSISDRHH